MCLLIICWFLWGNVYWDCLPIFQMVFWFLIVSCMNCLYILEIRPLSVASFANIFSQSTGCIFILFMASFLVQKPITLIRLYLSIFAFMSIALGGWIKKIFIQFTSENVLQNVLFQKFMMSWLKSLSHFEFIFVYGVRVCSNLIDLRAAVQFSNGAYLHFLKVISTFSEF